MPRLRLYTGVALAAILGRIAAQTPAQSQTPPDGWVYEGCFAQSDADALIVEQQRQITDQDNAECINICIEKGHNFAGTQYGFNCLCGNAISQSFVQGAQNGCDKACTNNPDVVCGGEGQGGSRNFVSLYATTGSVDVDGRTNAATDPTGSHGDTADSTYLGCYPSGFTDLVTPIDQITQELCETTCTDYAFWAVSPTDCTCGLTEPTDTAADDADCSDRCAGDNDEACGRGTDRVTAFKRTSGNACDNPPCQSSSSSSSVASSTTSSGSSSATSATTTGDSSSSSATTTGGSSSATDSTTSGSSASSATTTGSDTTMTTTSSATTDTTLTTTSSATSDSTLTTGSSTTSGGSTLPTGPAKGKGKGKRRPQVFPPDRPPSPPGDGVDDDFVPFNPYAYYGKYKYRGGRDY